MISERAFVNLFWGKDDAGYQVVQTRIRHSLATLQEVLQFYKERIAIEKEYNKKLDKLVLSVTLGSGETGTLKVALDKLQIETGHMVAQNDKFIRSVSLGNYEKLHNFFQIYHRNVTKIEQHMDKVVLRKADLWAHLELCREKYRVACGQMKTLTLLCQTTWGRELDKHKAKLHKVEGSVDGLRRSYQQAVDKYSEIHDVWLRDWAIALLNIYQLEIERVQMCKLNCFAYCNHVAALCVDWDTAADEARSLFAKVAAPKDAKDYAETYGTGNQIVGKPLFVDYMGGFDESPPAVTLAEFSDPDYSLIMTRTFSTQLGFSPKKTPSPTKSPTKAPKSPSKSPVKENGKDWDRKSLEGTFDRAESFNRITKVTVLPTKELPPIKNKTLTFNTANLLPERPADGLRKLPSHNSNYTSGAEEVFDKRNALQNSNGLSEYSNPTNYSTNTGGRSWASPRRKLVNAVQEQINRRLRDLSEMFAPPAPAPQQQNVPIAKDFSIDFIAQALEDLNAGGDGDMTKFRRSVRGAQLAQIPATLTFSNNALPPSDFVDDSNETATRYNSISFRTPYKPRPKSMADIPGYAEGDLVGTVVRLPAKRSLLRSPTKSYTNLNAFVKKVTPITRNKYETKAVAKYTYNAREDGELSFRKGWHMYVIHKQEDNWYVCELGENAGLKRGSVGLVPFNYVEDGDEVF